MLLGADLPWLRVLLEYLIKSTVVISCGLALVRLLRRRTASLRHFVLFLFLAGLLLLPVLSIAPAGWETRLLPPVNDSRPQPAAPVFSRTEARPLETLVLRTAADGPNSEPAAAPPAAASPTGLGNVGARFRIGAEALPVIWLAVFLFFVIRLTVGLGNAWRLTKESRTVDEPGWRALFARCLCAVRLRRTVRLKSHEDVFVPLTWGVRKPVVLLPEGHRDWTDEQRAAALVHELCHVKRADFLALVLVRLSLALYWFNPLCWVALSRLKKEQEKACDELVLRAGLKPSTYAANLLFFKRVAGVRWPASVALLGIVGGSSFQDRLASILKSSPVFKEVKMKTKLTLALSVILVVGLIGLARPSTAAADPVSGTLSAEPAVVADAGFQAGTLTAASEPPAQEKKAETQEEKKKEEQEKKAEKERTIIVKADEGKMVPLEITISIGDEVKTLVVEKSVTLKKGAGENLFIVSADGKEISLPEGKPFRLEIKSGELTLIKEGKALRVDEGGAVRVITEKGQTDTVTYHVVKPAGKVLKVEKGEAEGAKGVVMIGEKGKPAIAWTVHEDLSVIKEKLRVLREKLKKVTGEERDLHDIQEVLADLEADLAETAKEPEVGVAFSRKPHVFTIHEGTDKDKVDVWVTPVEKGARKDAITVTVSDKTDGISIVYAMSIGEKTREVYERIVERVKKELPEGYTLDPSWDEESGAVTLKVTGPAGEKAAKELIEKLSAIIKEEAKQDK